MIPFPKDFHDFLRLLHDNDARYLVIGGYALGYHGYVRATGDLDIFVEVSERNAERLVSVFTQFGFEQGVCKELFLAKGKMVRVGNPPMRLEILTEISGVTFDECYVKCERVVIQGVSICFIDLGSLIKNKNSTGRAKDKIDVENLKKHHDEEA
jgi:hypothetical protein